MYAGVFWEVNGYMDKEHFEIIQSIGKKSGYSPEAYLFTLETIHYVSNRLKEIEGRSRHVTCAEFALEFTLYAKERFGPLADIVLEEWNIKASRDIGVLVFDLIDNGMMGKNELDNLEQFADLFKVSEIARFNWEKDFDRKNIHFPKIKY